MIPISDDFERHTLHRLVNREHCDICRSIENRRSTTTFFCKECGAAMHRYHTDVEHVQFFTRDMELVRRKNFGNRRERQFVEAEECEEDETEDIPVEEMNRDQLRAACKARGLPVRGTVAEMLRRIKEYDERENPDQQGSTNS